MIDEYQDTSPLQDVCFAAVGRDDMFVVGDLKQSIYSFRGAKPEGFAKKRDVFRRIDLNKNFRSRKGVLDFANFVFSMIFSEEVGGVEYDDGERLNHGERRRPKKRAKLPTSKLTFSMRSIQKNSERVHSPISAMSRDVFPTLLKTATEKEHTGIRTLRFSARTTSRARESQRRSIRLTFPHITKAAAIFSSPSAFVPPLRFSAR